MVGESQEHSEDLKPRGSIVGMAMLRYYVTATTPVAGARATLHPRLATLALTDSLGGLEILSFIQRLGMCLEWLLYCRTTYRSRTLAGRMRHSVRAAVRKEES